MSIETFTNAKNNNSIVYIEKHIPLFNISTGGCSGFFVEPDKTVTNIHGIAGRGAVLVKSIDGKTTWKVEGVAGFNESRK